MWQANGQALTMTEGDFGVDLPVVISGVTFGAEDSVKISIKARENTQSIVEKVFTNIQNNTVTLVLTEAESELFPVGVYVYAMDWYKSGVFMCNIIEKAPFRVVDKA